MANLLKAVFLTLMTMFLWSCEKEISWPVEANSSQYTVVDGIITSEYKTQEIRICKSVSDPNDEPEAVTAAQVIVSSNDSVYTFSEDSARPGYYISQRKFAGIPNKEYTLFINNSGTIISGKSTMPEVADFNFLQYGHKGDNKTFTITWVAEPYSAGESAMFEILLDWSEVPGFETLPHDSTTARLMYYTLPTIDVSQLFAPVMERIKFPAGTRITEKKYSLTSEHAAFIRAMLAETNLQGGFFNSVPSNIPVYLSNNTLGYFGACAVISKTAIAGGN